jgi:DNA-binding transcriptional LysR family regulator
MELRQVRYFVAVAEEGNFGRAAEKLRIAQSGISQQIKALERSLGAELVDRSSRPIRLTPAGEAFLEEARLMLELADRAREQVQVVARQRRTVVNVGASAFGHPPAVDALLDAARKQLTDIDLQIHLDISSHNVASLRRRILDVTFSYVPFESDETPQYLRLGQIELGLALPEGHRLAALHRIPRSEIWDEPFLVSPRSANPSLADHVYQALFGREEPPRPVHISDVRGRFPLVAEGLGVSAVAIPTETAVPRPGVVYRRFNEPEPTIEFGLLWFEDHLSPPVESFLRLAREFAREEPTRVDLAVEEELAVEEA